MTKAHILRPFEPNADDYETIVKIYNLADPPKVGSAGGWQHRDRYRDPARPIHRHVVDHRGQIVGYGYTLHTDPVANRFRFAIFLLQEWETAALIDEFYTYVMGHCLLSDPTALICQTREDETEKIAWLRHKGFQPAMRYVQSVLNLAEFDPANCEAWSQISPPVPEIISLAELATRDPAWQRRVYDLEMLLNQDVPRPTGFTPPSFDIYRQREFEDPEFIPELWLVALDGDSFLGITSLSKAGENLNTLKTRFTGVHRDHRRRGLAVALKCRVIQTARRRGADFIHAANEENNPMLRLNLRLGFKIQSADVDWEIKPGRPHSGSSH